MSFPAVLDACVLYPASLRDTLLRCADAGFFEVVWSDRILEETRRNLVADGRASEHQAERLLRLMREAFPEAGADESKIGQLEPKMRCSPEDNHVAATAVAAGADAIVTLNLVDFPREALAPLGVTAVSPDDFLIEFVDVAPTDVLSILREQAADLTRPPVSADELLSFLAVTVPRFAARVRDLT